MFQTGSVKKTVRWTVFSGRGIREVFAPTRRIRRAEQRHFADTKVGGAIICWFKSSDQRKNDKAAFKKAFPLIPRSNAPLIRLLFNAVLSKGALRAAARGRRIRRAVQRHLADTKVGGAKSIGKQPCRRACV